MNQAAQNTDTEIWHETSGDFYSPSIHVTNKGAIGINVGGTVIVKDVRKWHAMADHPQCLTEWFTADDIAEAKHHIGDCPQEVLQMVAVFLSLEWSTRQHAIDLQADGLMFRAEDATNRANRYRDSVKALVEIWGSPETDEE